MKILILISTLSFGGAEKQAMIDANLLSMDHHVILGTFSAGPLKEQLSFNVKHISFRKDNYIFTIIRLIKIIKRNNIEIINAFLFASMVISGIASFIIKIPVVWHFHSHEYGIPILHKYILKLISKTHNVRKILFVSNELKDYFLRYFRFPESKAEVLYNSSLVKSVRVNKVNTDRIDIGYVGRIVKLKRVGYLMDLANYLKKKNINFMIHIVGDGEEKANIEDYGKKIQVNDVVKFWGFQRSVEKFYDKFDIFILPSREECLSMALIDAAMKGIPTVAFDVGGNNEIIISGKTGYIVYTKEEMFDKVNLLISDKDLRDRLGKAAHERAVQLFSEEAHKKAVNNIYESIFS